MILSKYYCKYPFSSPNSANPFLTASIYISDNNSNKSYINISKSIIKIRINNKTQSKPSSASNP